MRNMMTAISPKAMAALTSLGVDVEAALDYGLLSCSGFRSFGGQGGSCGKCQLRFWGLNYVVVAITYGKSVRIGCSYSIIECKID